MSVNLFNAEAVSTEEILTEMERLANEIHATKSTWVKIRNTAILLALAAVVEQSAAGHCSEDIAELFRLLREIKTTGSDWVKIRNIIEAVLLVVAKLKQGLPRETLAALAVVDER